jgi:hypothetical protein
VPSGRFVTHGPHKQQSGSSQAQVLACDCAVRVSGWPVHEEKSPHAFHVGRLACMLMASDHVSLSSSEMDQLAM